MRSFFDTSYPRTSNRGSFAPPPSDAVDARALAAGIAERHAIPAGSHFVLFSATGDFFAKFGDSSVTAAVPSADVVDGSAAELNPAARAVPAGTTHVSLVADADCLVTLAFYAE